MDLSNRLLEVSVWDYVRYGANDFLGELTLDLGNHPLDDEPEWYILQPHQHSSFNSVSILADDEVKGENNDLRYNTRYE